MAVSAAEGPIRYIWFDQDDTLYDYHDAMHRAMSRCVATIHEHFPQTRETLDVAGLIEVRSELTERADRSGWDFVRARREAFGEAIRRYADAESELGEHLAGVYYEALKAGIAPFAGTIECLRELARDYTLGIISNGMSLVEELGIADLFAHRVYALETGLAKPDRAVFEHAMAITGAGPEAHVLVGDSAFCDVVGAREAGWRSVWLNRDGRPWEIEAEPPELTIASLAELPALIAELNAT